MTTETQLTTRASTEVALVSSQPVAQMLQAVIEKGITAENVTALEQIVGLYERMQAKDAERAFSTAFVALQSDMTPIQAMRVVPDNHGGVRYNFAPFEDIMRQVKPLLQKHGFTVSFSMDVGDGKVTQHCTLRHIGGHSQMNSFTARVGKGPPGSTDTQADGAASTYAKRFALCDALAIVVERDGDARSEGALITAEQADELRRRVKATGSDEKLFLQVAGAGFFEDIGADRYNLLDAMLAKKEQKR